MHLPPAPETATLALLVGEFTRLVGDTAEIRQQLQELLKNQPPDNQTPPTPGRVQPASSPDSAEAFWHSLIDTKAAAAFLDMSPRRLEGLRYIGGGPRFRAISPRCVRYTRLDLAEWAEKRSRANTSA